MSGIKESLEHWCHMNVCHTGLRSLSLPGVPEADRSQELQAIPPALTCCRPTVLSLFNTLFTSAFIVGRYPVIIQQMGHFKPFKNN